MKVDYTTNSHYLTYTFLFKRLGECAFLNLGVKGLSQTAISSVLHTYHGQSKTRTMKLKFITANKLNCQGLVGWTALMLIKWDFPEQAGEWHIEMAGNEDAFHPIGCTVYFRIERATVIKVLHFSEGNVWHFCWDFEQVLTHLGTIQFQNKTLRQSVIYHVSTKLFERSGVKVLWVELGSTIVVWALRQLTLKTVLPYPVPGRLEFWPPPSEHLTIQEHCWYHPQTRGPWPLPQLLPSPAQRQPSSHTAACWYLPVGQASLFVA